MELRESFFSSWLLEPKNMIKGGDMNLFLSEREIWAPTVRLNGLSNFFAALFNSKGWIDLQPLKMEPTWRNNRCGEKEIWKRMDRFLLSDNLLTRPLIEKYWVEVGGLSNHLPILLLMERQEHKTAPLFRFNPSWLQEKEY